MSTAIQHRVDGDGILRILFDAPDEPVNVLHAHLLEHLGKLLDEARPRDDIRGLFLGSSKPGIFLAGMDLTEIAEVTDAYRASEGARLGQSIFQRIADLGKPSVCAIGGTCLGGGTELALACTFRVAADDPSIRIGLPEVKLGIIPGFGGSQRLPRLVGPLAAIDLILTGKELRPKQALKLGLIDRMVPEGRLTEQSLQLLRDCFERGSIDRPASMHAKRNGLDRLIENVGPVRRWVIGRARERTGKKIRAEQYPAPFRALEAIEAALTQPIADGLGLEARIVGQLVPTPTSKNLIWLFQNQAALKSSEGGIQAAPRRVRKLAVVGAGIMGGGIARLAADREIPVRLRDLHYDAILTALQTARKVWDYKLKRRRITPREVDQKMAFIAPTLDESGLRQADVVIEAVVERLEVKQQVLAEIEPRIHDRAVFASNTSSLPITEIAARAHYPERVVGMHFFNPVHRMPLVEVIAGRRSSPEAVATVRALAIRMGKVPVVVQDGPGFLVNRVLTLYLNEAMQMLMEGLRIEDVDRAMVAFGMPMGPFALLDQVGLDTAQHVGEVLEQAFGARVSGTESVLEALVGAGRLGQKTGRGFYRYRSGKRLHPDGENYRLVGDPESRKLPPETLQERMVLAMINEAAICLQEGVVREPRDVDVAMVMGTGFPPFRGGLLRHADAVGVPIVADRLGRLAEAQGDRFRPAELWADMVRRQQRFYE